MIEHQQNVIERGIKTIYDKTELDEPGRKRLGHRGISCVNEQNYYAGNEDYKKQKHARFKTNEVVVLFQT